MENSAENLINELAVGKGLARQLQIHLNAPSSSHETRELLVNKILNSYDKALYMLKGNATGVETQSPGVTLIGVSESPRSLSASPRSEDSDREFHRDQKDPRDTPRKRKTMPRWTKHVQVCPGTGLEGPLDDGFSWRKYGQKDILGAKYPRGYYRCTHRHVQGCLATKQVQRSDDHPTIFEITYRGRHTCSQGSEVNPPSTIPANQEPSSGVNYQPVISQPQQNQQEMLLSFQTGLKVITENLDNHHQPISSLSFPSTSTINAENYPFCPSVIENNFAGNASPSFMSPATSGTNCFSVSSSRQSSFAGNHSSHASESDLTDLISAAVSSATNPPTVGLSIPFGQMEFEPNFTFGNPGFFS